MNYYFISAIISNDRKVEKRKTRKKKARDDTKLTIFI